MATLREQYSGNSFWNEIEGVIAEASSKRPLSDIDRDLIKRVAAVLTYAKTFKGIDPYLLRSEWPRVLENARTSLDIIFNQLQGWDDSGAMPSPAADEIQAHLDAIGEYVAKFPAPVGISRVRDALSLVQGVSDAADAQALSLAQQLKDLGGELTLYRTVAGELSAELKARDEALAKYQSQVQADIDKAKRSAGDQFNAVAAEGQRLLQDEAKALNDAATKVMASLDERKIAADRVVALIGGAGVADGYTKYADRQTKAAFWWSLSAVILGFVAVAYIGFALWDLHLSSTPSPATVILKSAVSITGLSVAGYMTRLAAHHRTQAVKARFRALDMVALGPFSEDLTPEQKQSLKFNIGVASFGQDMSDDDKKALLDMHRDDAKS